MKKLWTYLRAHPLAILLFAIPLAVIARVAGWNTIIVFIFSALGVVPLAGYIGEATEALAEHTGPQIGGLLNATLGNAAELIITLVAVNAGLLELVKASITGSILGNLLLVMGVSMVAGGTKFGLQSFDRRRTGNNAILLILSILALVIPSFFGHTILANGAAHVADESAFSQEVETLSLGVAVIMVVLYALGLLYSFRRARNEEPDTPFTSEPPSAEVQHWNLRTAIIVLAVSTIGVVVLSELLVGAVEGVVQSLGLSEFFLGIILIPIVGNVAEHVVAVQVALRNEMDLSLEIALSSSLQIALFVAPLLVFISLAMGHPLTLIFNPFELAALGAGVLVAAMVSIDGESNWLEGATLVAVYLILGIAFFLLPTV